MKKLTNFPELERGVELNKSLTDFVTFRIGGEADIFVEPQDQQELVTILEYCRDKEVPYFILGSGSNLLIRDGGLRGVVIHLSQLESVPAVIADEEDFVFVEVPSSMLKARLLEWALESSYEGLEFSAGIPGSVGGAVFMNAGTRWGSYSSVIEKLRLWHPKDGVKNYGVDELGMRYRGHDTQVFHEGAVVLSVVFRLKKSRDIEKSRSLVSMILSYRGGRQPLTWPNCGSVFKNPEKHKKGAGRLIEASGLKGHRIGALEISQQHANFFLNRGGATSDDVEAMLEFVKDKVSQDHGVDLEPELIVVGEKKKAESEVFVPVSQ